MLFILRGQREPPQRLEQVGRLRGKKERIRISADVDIGIAAQEENTRARGKGVEVGGAGDVDKHGECARIMAHEVVRAPRINDRAACRSREVRGFRVEQCVIDGNENRCCFAGHGFTIAQQEGPLNEIAALLWITRLLRDTSPKPCGK